MAVFVHEPVLPIEVADVLGLKPGMRLVDATVGAAGHALELIPHILPGGRFLGVDRDPEAIAVSARRLAPFGAAVALRHGNFSHLDRFLEELGWPGADGLLVDLGVSSPQLDRNERGFSYMEDGPLDMRMDPGETITAADLVNELAQRELARILRDYGEERWASRIAQFIVERRVRQPYRRTGELVETIRAAIPTAARRHGPHPARRTFQALRIAVNDELGSLETLLAHVDSLLAPGGRVAVIAFHSLEDRRVKQALRELGRQGRLEDVARRPVVAGAAECERNPRARSARLRWARRPRVLPTIGEE